MKRLSAMLGACTLLAALSGGCQAVVDYPIDRAMDFADILGADFYWGQGVLVNARGTKLVQAGVGKFDGSIASYDKRAAGVADEVRAEAGLPLYYFTLYDRKAEMGNQAYVDRIDAIEGMGEVKYNPTDPQDRDYYQIGGEVAVFLGLGIHLDLLQFVDFTFGWFGLDIGRDDRRHQETEDVHGPRYERISELPVSVTKA